MSPYIIIICGGATHADSCTLVWWARDSKGMVLPPQVSICGPYGVCCLWCRHVDLQKTNKKHSFVLTSRYLVPNHHQNMLPHHSVWACGNWLLSSGLWWSFTVPHWTSPFVNMLNAAVSEPKIIYSVERCAPSTVSSLQVRSRCQSEPLKEVLASHPGNLQSGEN